MLKKFIIAGIFATGCAHSGPLPETEQATALSAEKGEARSAGTERAPPSFEKAEARFQELVRRAETGEAIDFHELRLAWLHGPAMKPDPREERLPALKKAMFEAMQKGGDPRVVLAHAREIIDIRYVDLDAQKARRQACELLEEEPCTAYRVVSLGLLKSVVEGRDGSSCPTAWRVVSVDEEYFVLRMLDARFVRQSLVSEEGGICDVLDVEYEGEEKTFYFEVSEVFEARRRMLGLEP